MGRKFSIIVPIYKVEKYLYKCLNSIKNQTFKDFEVVLVVDGSPDNCLAICHRYEERDKRFITVYKDNGGLVSARKAGATVATGDYVICVDGDDWIDLNFLETINSVLEKDNVDVICCGYYIARGKKKIRRQLNERIGHYSEEDIRKEIIPHLIESVNTTSFFPAVWAKAYKREQYVYNQLKVDNRIGMGEDSACTIPLIMNTKCMRIIPECLYYYRQNNNSMTKTRKKLSWDSYRVVVEHFYNILDKNQKGIIEQLNRRIVHSFFTVAKSQFYEKGNYFATRKMILEEMKKPIISNAIKNCTFTSSVKAFLINCTVKKRMIWLLFLLSKIW